jgi:hypothetical protein
LYKDWLCYSSCALLRHKIIADRISWQVSNIEDDDHDLRPRGIGDRLPRQIDRSSQNCLRVSPTIRCSLIRKDHLDPYWMVGTSQKTSI